MSDVLKRGTFNCAVGVNYDEKEKEIL